MAADEDMELRDLLLETLEKKGVINRIKAELRASVYLALDEQEGIRPFEKSTEQVDVLATDEGRLATSLVHDFLHSCNLKFTLSVLEPEAPLAEPLSREELCSRLGLEQQKGPLLLQLLHPVQQTPASQSPDSSHAKVAAPEPVAQNKAADSAPAKDELAELALGGTSRGGSRLPPLSGPKVLPSLEPQVSHPEGESHSLQSTTSRKTDHSGSEESVEEELSRIDDSSLSTTADDRTVDLTVSRASDVEGCDYAEPAH
ncbi:centrosomal protein 43 [Rhipicephalus sanguineus]|uniref:centrosomal protein 43 n=1 Tax=Rhipicephalus sanguineus TaxID=34632 RepID=UPI00189345B5|nr:centrosomal protein 43 [Rhipicephalus sanguineus]